MNWLIDWLIDYAVLYPQNVDRILTILFDVSSPYVFLRRLQLARSRSPRRSLELNPWRLSRLPLTLFYLELRCYFAPNVLAYTGATTAEKLQRTWRGVGADPPFSSAVPSPSPVVVPPLFHPFPSQLFFPSPLEFSKEIRGASHSAQRKKWQPVAKVGGDQIHLVPT